MLCDDEFKHNDASNTADIFEIPSVTGEWVMASIRLGYQACPYIHRLMPTQLFQSIVAVTSEVNATDRRELDTLIATYSSQVEWKMTPATKHLVCDADVGPVYSAMEKKSDDVCVTAKEIINA